MGVSQPTAAKYLDTLAENGFVEKHRSAKRNDSINVALVKPALTPWAACKASLNLKIAGDGDATSALPDLLDGRGLMPERDDQAAVLCAANTEALFDGLRLVGIAQDMVSCDGSGDSGH